MVAAALRGRRAQNGVRPFDPYRDLGPVAELIVTAFGGKLDPAGQVMLEKMCRGARWGPLLVWLYWPGWSSAAVAPGFVWTEEGRVVGNVSLRRALGWDGFLIGNVAVHPNWQGRGIARALMEAVLEEILARGGRWAGLEVQAGNQQARRLYEHLGFRDVGRTLHMLRPAGLPWAGNSTPHPSLRRGHSHDSEALIELVRAIVPESHRPLLRLPRADYQPGWERTLDCWLRGRREVWWVAEEGGAVRGAVRALHERGRCPDRLEVLVAPEHGGCFETVLVQQGLTSLRGASKKTVETVLPSCTEPLIAALEAVGFQRLRLLVQMRLDIRSDQVHFLTNRSSML